MALLHTPDFQNGFAAPNFTLNNVGGRQLSFDDVSGENGTVVAFICNHCPYVLAIIDRFVEDAKMLQTQGIGVVTIMSNDTARYPADSFENMIKFAQKHDFSFPYLIDESQKIAKAYDAVCTPDIFGFDGNGVLQYRGRLDSAGAHEADDHTVKEMVNAMHEIAQGDSPTQKQHPSMGCSIKWR